MDLDGNSWWSKHWKKAVAVVAVMAVVATVCVVGSFGCGAALATGARFVAGRAAAAAPKVLNAGKAAGKAFYNTKVGKFINNGNNVLRIGPKSDGTFRASLAAAPKHYNKLSAAQKKWHPYSVHIERSKQVFTRNRDVKQWKWPRE